MASKILLSIVIATVDRSNELILCLSSLRRVFTKRELESVEIVVVDQSTIKNQSILRIFSGLKIKYILSSVRNASHARNLGVAHSNSEYLWFLDDDAQVLSFNLNMLKTERPVLFVEWKEKPKVYSRFYIWDKLNLLRRSGTPFYIVKRDGFKCVGGFNMDLGPGSKLKGGEDLDLLLRLNLLNPINDFTICGELTHPIENSGREKRIAYYHARGYVLAANREFLLFLINLFFDLFMVARSGAIRPVMLFRGFLKGLAR